VIGVAAASVLLVFAAALLGHTILPSDLGFVLGAVAGLLLAFVLLI
jgi:hypothetical protein